MTELYFLHDSLRHDYRINKIDKMILSILKILQSCLTFPSESQRRSESFGCRAGQPAERSGEVTLTGEARTQGNLGDWQFRLLQHLLRTLDPAFRNVIRRRHSHRLLERSRKMEVAHAHRTRDRTQRDTSFLFVRQVMIDQRDRLS